MALGATIRALLRPVPGLLGDATLAWRIRTSAPGIEAETWSAWTTFAGLISNKTLGEERDELAGGDKRVWRARLRVSDQVALGFNYQVRDVDSVVWAIGGPVGQSLIESSGPGTTAWHLMREETGQAGADRGAGA